MVYIFNTSDSYIWNEYQAENHEKPQAPWQSAPLQDSGRKNQSLWFHPFAI